MFSITVSVGQSAFMLLYRTEEKARTYWNALQRAPNNDVGELIVDDFGKEFSAPPANINGMLFENHILSQEGNVEISLHHAKTQVRAQKRAASDPELRQPGFGNQGHVITPAGLNGRPPF